MHLFSRPTLVTLACGILVVASVGLTGLLEPHRAPGTEQPTPPPLVPVVRAEIATGFDSPRRFVGRVEARRASALGFELDGLVVEVIPEEGDRIAAGSAVARLDRARLEAQLAELSAIVAQEEAGLELARSTLERYRQAVEARAVSQQNLAEATQDVATRQASLQRARAAVERVEVDLAKCVLRAPYDAVVTARLVDEGAVLRPGQTVVELIEVRSPEARIGVAGPSIEALELGMQRPLKLPASGHVVRGTLRAIPPRRDERSRSVEAVFELEAELGADLRSGDLVELELTRRIEAKGTWLPLVALTETSRGLWAAYVARPAEGGTHELVRRQVEVLAERADRAYVRGTIAEGDLVVVDRLQALAPGMRVRAQQRVALDDVGDAPEETR
jgi:RND family efflux transporter MFP subunit